MSEEPTPIPFTNVSPCECPEEFNILLGAAPVWEGEQEGEYYDISDMMFQDLVPRSYIEQLFAIDLVDITFEILSLRRVKVALKAMSYGEAIEALLRRALLSDAPVGAEKLLRIEAKLEAKKWRENPESRPAIQARLTKMGIDDDAILAEMFAQSRTALPARSSRIRASGLPATGVGPAEAILISDTVALRDLAMPKRAS